jgi:hypothetical protein
LGWNEAEAWGAFVNITSHFRPNPSQALPLEFEVPAHVSHQPKTDQCQHREDEGQISYIIERLDLVSEQPSADYLIGR